MRKLLLVISIMFVVLIFSSNANALQAIDTQDATNWGDYFLPDNTDPYSAPYYRWGNEDWGWKHTLNIEVGKTPAEYHAKDEWYCHQNT